jgi:hypothetical protein
VKYRRDATGASGARPPASGKAGGSADLEAFHARYVALLRGVGPMNCKMPELQRSLLDAGFTSVKTMLSSGNVHVDAPGGCHAGGMGRHFATHVRSRSSCSG